VLRHGLRRRHPALEVPAASFQDETVARADHRPGQGVRAVWLPNSDDSCGVRAGTWGKDCVYTMCARRLKVPRSSRSKPYCGGRWSCLRLRPMYRNHVCHMTSWRIDARRPALSDLNILAEYTREWSGLGGWLDGSARKTCCVC